MSLDLDISMLLIFLLMSIFISIYYSKESGSFRRYLNNGQVYNIFNIVFNVISNWVGGVVIFYGFHKIYINPLLFFGIRFCSIVFLIFSSYLIIFRIKNFFNNISDSSISVAQIMGDIYGNKVKFITGISSILLLVTVVALRIQILSSIFCYFLGFNYVYAALLGTNVIVLYSSLANAKSVTLIEILKINTFLVFIPILTIFTIMTFADYDSIINLFNYNYLFNYKNIFKLHNIKFYSLLSFILLTSLSVFCPSNIQRILLLRNSKNVGYSFALAFIVFIILMILVSVIVISILSIDTLPCYGIDNIIAYVIDEYFYPGLKGWILIALCAIVISGTDAYINTAIIIFTNDVVPELGMEGIAVKCKSIDVFRAFVGCIGIVAFIFSLAYDMFELVLLSSNFYAPIVIVPLIIAILGFNFNIRAIHSGIIAGAISIIIWRYYIQTYIEIDSLIPGIVSNFLTLIIVNYSLKYYTLVQKRLVFYFNKPKLP